MAKGTLNDPVRIAKKIRRFTSRDESRPILCGIHLDECGDVVATDSYRLFIEHGAWDGPSIDLPAETLDELTKRKLKGNDTATVEYESKGEIVKTELSGGERFADSHPGGTYPNYKSLCGGKVNTIAYVKTKELLPIVQEHIKLNQTVLIDVTERDLRVRGVGEEPLPEYRVEKACDGADNEVTLNATYLRDALNVCGEVAEIRIESHIKPVAIVDGNTEIVVMPVRMVPTKATTKKAEPKREKPLTSTTNEELARSIYRIALDRAASDPDSRVEGNNAQCHDRNLVFEYERAGKLTKETHGDYTSWYRDGEFVTCIERRWSKRKIHLTYPELKPFKHKADLVAARKTEPKKEDNDMENRIKELEEQLKATRAELDAVWKENEHLKRSKPEPKAEPKAETPKPKVDVPTTVTLETMQEWCEGKGLIATQKREGTCIWVEGASKPYADELKELGFRFAKKRKSWYLTPAE